MKTLLHLGLALDYASSVKEFRRSWVDAIKPKTTVQEGFPLQHYDDYIAIVLRWFVPGNQNRLLRKTLAVSLPRTDWTNQEEIALIVAPGTKIAHMDTFIDNALNAWATVLIPRKLRILSRKGWLGKTLPMCGFGLLDAFHGSLRPAFLLMSQRMGKSKKKAGGRANS